MRLFCLRQFVTNVIIIYDYSRGKNFTYLLASALSLPEFLNIHLVKYLMILIQRPYIRDRKLIFSIFNVT